MTRSRKKRRRKRGRQRLEEHAASLLERFLAWLGVLVASILRALGRLVRRVASSFAGASTATQTMVIVCVAASVVLFYYQHVDELETGRPAVWIDSDVEALARVIRSETGASPTTHRIHIAWATRNLARERKQTIAKMACSPCGRQERGRPVSSRMKARDADRVLAHHILAQPPELDPTGGATHFINPRVQDLLARSGKVPGYKGRTYERVRRRWQRKYGWEPYYRLGPDLEMWGKRRDRKRR